MNRIALYFLVAMFAVSSVNGAIMSSEVRSQKLDAIRKLVSAGVVQVEEERLGVAPSPFSSDLGIMAEEVKLEELVLSDEELLEKLSNHVNPTGIFMFGGEFYLIFKEKKLKVGSELAVEIDGFEHSVKIAEITGSTYRIQKGDAELQLKLK